MNSPIVRLYGLIALLFGVLVVATSWWSVFTASKLRDNTANRRPLLAEERIKRGDIRSADGRVLARSVKIDKERYRRTYPAKDLFAHAVGYSYTSIGRSGLEQFRNDPLTGRRTELIGAVDSLLNKRGVGDSIRTTLNAKAQQAAIDGLKGRKGAVVALEPSTGAVLAMASTPAYDPNGLDQGDKFKRLSTDDANSPLVNRATQSGYPPGSTMKAVTATAALDTGKYTPGSRVSGKNGKKISGVPLNNFGGEDFGDIDLTFALTNSVNTVWAEVGEKLGRQTMADYMTKFGFYKQPPIDLPTGQLLASGERERGKLLPPTSRKIDVGRMAIGQDKLLVTPLQMATVAATIANGGVRMKPHITQKIVDPDGRTQDEIQGVQAERVMKAATASALTAMMKNVVKEGTGTAAALQGVDLAGKTGTAEIDIGRKINDPWFIGFTNDFAVAVVLERVQGGTGGVVAAPVAKQVLEALGGK
ncbi:MAG: penicillin-binding protein [Solirubrobacteraceae bacterium]|jgi:peptidoglycan glycosyltransferase|nr:penicillin-binding protein [Solirubrobacteraceae bacterium]